MDRPDNIDQSPPVSPKAEEQLRNTILTTCAAHDDFPLQLEACLGAALRLLAAEPEVVRLVLSSSPHGSGESGSERGWIERYGRLMRHAAATDPDASEHPFFIEPFLLDGIRFRVASCVLAGETAQLECLLPGALEFLLAFYFRPGAIKARSRRRRAPAPSRPRTPRR